MSTDDSAVADYHGLELTEQETGMDSREDSDSTAFFKTQVIADPRRGMQSPLRTRLEFAPVHGPAHPPHKKLTTWCYACVCVCFVAALLLVCIAVLNPHPNLQPLWPESYTAQDYREPLTWAISLTPPSRPEATYLTIYRMNQEQYPDTIHETVWLNASNAPDVVLHHYALRHLRTPGLILFYHHGPYAGSCVYDPDVPGFDWTRPPALHIDTLKGYTLTTPPVLTDTSYELDWNNTLQRCVQSAPRVEVQDHSSNLPYTPVNRYFPFIHEAFSKQMQLVYGCTLHQVEDTGVGTVLQYYNIFAWEFAFNEMVYDVEDMLIRGNTPSMNLQDTVFYTSPYEFPQLIERIHSTRACMARQQSMGLSLDQLQHFNQEDDNTSVCRFVPVNQSCQCLNQLSVDLLRADINQCGACAVRDIYTNTLNDTACKCWGHAGVISTVMRSLPCTQRGQTNNDSHNNSHPVFGATRRQDVCLGTLRVQCQMRVVIEPIPLPQPWVRCFDRKPPIDSI